MIVLNKRLKALGIYTLLTWDRRDIAGGQPTVGAICCGP